MWNFEEKPTLEGTLVEKEEGVGKMNSTVYRFKTATGDDVSFWGSKVLDDKLTDVEKFYGMGAKIRIRFNGMVKGKSGSHYKDFTVEAWDPSVETKNTDGSTNSPDAENATDPKNIPF